MGHFTYVEPDKPHSVYRLFAADGALLYVGMSKWPHWRIAQHRDKAWWPDVADWTVEEFPNRNTAATAERDAIIDERPRYNGTYNEANPNRQPSRLRPAIRPRGTCPRCKRVYAYMPSPSYGDWPPAMQYHKRYAPGPKSSGGYYDRCEGVGKPPLEWQKASA